ncbi:MAG: hypothetical protein JW973_17595 [Bacteroidales bacterium]|nr:hypothetical protein [Bacteroidales bacterium]
MISEREKYERFENYLKGSMNDEAKSAFENDLSQDVEFNRAFEDYRLAHNLILESGLLDIRQELNNLHVAQLKTGRLWRMIRNILIPTGIILTGALLYYLMQQDGLQPEKIVAGSGTEIGNIPLIAGNEGDMVHDTDTTDVRLQPEKLPANTIKTKKTDLTIVSTDIKQDEIISKPVKPIIKPVATEKVIENITLPVALRDTSIVPERIPYVDEKKSIPLSPDCERVKITCDFITESTCADGSQGMVVFLTQTLKGGNAPYEFSITGGTDFVSQALFSNLQSGSYRLVVRDANRCFTIIGTAVVDAIECDFRFAPALGEVWEIPFMDDKNGKLFIFSKDGKMLYSANVGPSYDPVWNGNSLNGDPLPLGVYIFRIEFRDGRRYNGTVTIIK